MEPHFQQFERTLAWHCAPSLAGIKPADLISYHPRPGEPADLPARYDRMLSPRGIRVRALCRCPRGSLLLVYRPGELARQLEEPGVRALLVRAGYPAEGDLEALLGELAGRLGRGGTLPPRGGAFPGLSPGGRGGLLPRRGTQLQAVRPLEGVRPGGGGPGALPRLPPLPGRPVPPDGGGADPVPALPRGLLSLLPAPADCRETVLPIHDFGGYAT